MNMYKMSYLSKKNIKQGFSLAEAMITLLIVSLILAAVVPVVSKRQATPDKIWNYTYTTTGTPTANIYWGIKDGQSAVIGGHSVPDSALGARLSLITAADNASLTDQVLRYSIRRPLLSFFQRSGTTVVPLGKISFDQWGNSAIGSSSMNSTIPTVIDSTIATPINEDTVDSGVNDRGSLNTTLGFGTLFSNTTGARNIAIGSNSLITNTTGYGNVAAGVNSLRANISGASNVAVGTSTLMLNTTGSENTAVGAQALKHNIQPYNTAIGSHALWLNERGANNIAIGVNAMKIANYQDATFTNSQNVAIGNNALSNNRGTYNTAVGDVSLNVNTTGIWNTALGHASLISNTTGGSNTSLGLRSCDQVTTGSSNICIGAWSGPTAANSGLSSRLYIDVATRDDPLIGGDFANRTVTINNTLIGNLGGSFGTTYLGPCTSATTCDMSFDGGADSGFLFNNTGAAAGYTAISYRQASLLTVYNSGAAVWAAGGYTSSDKRWKKDITPLKGSLEKMLKLQGVTYYWRKKEFPNKPFNNEKQIGLIAQDVEKIFPELIFTDKSGYKNLDYSKFSPIIIEAVKELYAKVISNLNRIIVLEKKIKILEIENAKLKSENKVIKSQNDRIQKELSSINTRLKKLEQRK